MEEWNTNEQIGVREMKTNPDLHARWLVTMDYSMQGAVPRQNSFASNFDSLVPQR
jgi:hypothetical protein